MSRCNVDFFNTKLKYVFHDSVDMPSIDLDYLTPESSSFEISQTNAIEVGYIVRFEDNQNFVAIVDNIQPGEGKTTIHVKPFLSIFDQPVLFDTNWQYSSSGNNSRAKSLEQTIADIISSRWINSDDADQNIPISINILSNTSNWSFGLIGDKSNDSSATNSNNHFCIVEFYDTIIQNALMRYRVSINSYFNDQLSSVILTIGVPTGSKYIEADLPGISIYDFTIGKIESELNKLEIWNDDNYTTKVTYYLHTDGTYNTNGSINRIHPVKTEIISVSPEKNSSGTVTKDFNTVAKEQADQQFGDIKWKNYIELDMDINNTFNTGDLMIGQLAQIVHNGATYETILTGKKIGGYLTLIFGTIRVDLTKKTQLEASVEYTNSKSVTKNSSTSLT